MSNQEDILNEIQKNNSAEELNKNSQSIYVYDLVYVSCKIFLFLILGAIYVLFFKNAETIKDVLTDAKDNLMVAKDKIKEKIKPMVKPEVKPDVKPEVKPSLKVETNSNKNANKNANKNSNTNKTKS